MAADQTIVHDRSILHYHTYGHGSKIMLAFHGFGMDGTSFQPLAETLANTYTVYSFDLFFHGKSYWSNLNERISKAVWIEIINKFLQQKNITSFTLCGFSMGARFAMTIAEKMPRNISKLVLVAPDGIKTSTWYSLATYPIFLKSYFRSFIVKPHRFFHLVSVFKKLRLLGKGLAKFATSQMNTIRQRRRVYYSWTLFKSIQVNISTFSKLLNQYHIPCLLFIGKHDKIITKARMKSFVKKTDNITLKIINTGHNHIVESIAIDTDALKGFL